MTVIIKRERKLLPSIKQNRFFIIKDIFKNITNNKPFLVIHLNIDILFKAA